MFRVRGLDGFRGLDFRLFKVRLGLNTLNLHPKPQDFRLLGFRASLVPF